MKDIKLYSRVISLDDGEPGTVNEIDVSGGIAVQFDNGYETWLEYGQVKILEYEV